MISFLRRLKPLYSLYNFFHKKELYHNEALYKKLGLKKRYYSPVSSSDFKHLPRPAVPFSPDKEKLQACSLFARLSDADKESIFSFAENGYAVIKSYLSKEQVEAINREIDSLLDQKKATFSYRNKIMFAIHLSPLLNKVGNDEELKEVLGELLGGNAVLFQSINFLMGSEQATHSDSIHMTTYPLGGLLGVWIALEDISDENGPLHYYPGSHKLPYYFNSDYQNEGNALLLGDKSYEAYEKMIEQKVKELQLQKVKFFAQKGDLLIWHANLLHGGEPHRNKEKTRKSMVLHYFKEGAICYHEITQRPALIKRNK